MIEYTREFICLAGCLSFSRAAKALNVSQPSLSRHIADLEGQLGFKLFDRNPLSLTPAGKYYLESMTEVVSHIEAVIEQGRRIANGCGGLLTISMVPFDMGVYSGIVYETIAGMREENPGFLAQFYTSRSYTIEEAVVSGKADVGVLFSVPERVPDSLVCTHLLDYPCMVWASRDNPAVQMRPARLSNFENCVLVRSNNKVFSEWYNAEAAVLDACGVPFGQRVRDVESLADYFVTMRSDEIKITSDMDVACPYSPNVVGVHFSDEPVTFSTYLFYRPDSRRPVVESFVGSCLKVAGRYARGEGSYAFSGRA